MSDQKGYYAFDLDGTLARYEGWNGGKIGPPIPAMVAKLKHYLDQGIECRIMTARVGACPSAYSEESQRFADEAFISEQITLITEWCREHIGCILPITSQKTFDMILLFDDRCRTVIPNTGIILEEQEILRQIASHIEDEELRQSLKLASTTASFYGRLNDHMRKLRRQGNAITGFQATGLPHESEAVA